MNLAHIAAALILLSLLTPTSFAFGVPNPKVNRLIPPRIAASASDLKDAGFSCPLIPGATASGCSLNWGGYVVPGDDGSVSAVSGSWVVPEVNCPSLGDTYSSYWVGIDGFTSGTVEQVGTDSDCAAGIPVYYAWFEFFPAFSVGIDSMAVGPGDIVTASVTYSSVTGNFTTSISSSGGGSNVTSQSVPAAARSSAEWIVERPEICAGICILTQLADFGSVGLGLSFTGVTGTNTATIDSQTFSLGNFPDMALTMAGSLTGPSLAQPSPTSPDGTSFAVNYPSSVAVTCAGPSAVVGSPTSCTAHVGGLSPHGVVTWYSNGTGRFSSASCLLIGGECSARYTPLSAAVPAGLTASYSGDQSNPPAYGAHSLPVDPKSSTSRLTCTPSKAAAGSTRVVGGITVGRIGCVATVTGFQPTGGGSWSVAIIGGGGATLTSVGVPVVRGNSETFKSTWLGTVSGTAQVQFAFDGDVNNLPSSGEFNVTVTQARPTLLLTCAPRTLSVNATTDCTATLKGYYGSGGSVDGEAVTWSIVGGAGSADVPSSCTMTAGQCSVSLRGTGTGGVSIKASYAGDANDHSAQRTLSLKVSRTASLVSVICAQGSLTVGQTTTCTATVTGYLPGGWVGWFRATGSGKVTFSSPSCVLSSSACSVVVTATGAGGLSIEAFYHGDADNKPSTTTSPMTVS